MPWAQPARYSLCQCILLRSGTGNVLKCSPSSTLSFLPETPWVSWRKNAMQPKLSSRAKPAQANDGITVLEVSWMWCWRPCFSSGLGSANGWAGPWRSFPTFPNLGEALLQLQQGHKCKWLLKVYWKRAVTFCLLASTGKQQNPTWIHLFFFLRGGCVCVDIKTCWSWRWHSRPWINFPFGLLSLIEKHSSVTTKPACSKPTRKTVC